MPHVAAISFPMIDPVLFQVGPVAVRWYGLAYVAAFLLGYIGLRRMIRSGRLRLSVDQLWDLVFWLAAGVMLGGRLGWWIFYHRGGASEPWYELLAIWNGGMSFHGGLIGVAAAISAWAWHKRTPLFNIADCVAFVAPLGLFFGRIANFINAELVGRPTTIPWGVIFPGETFARHPSQLYEAILEGPLLLALLWLVSRRQRASEGSIAATFLVLYGLLRFVVEFSRQPDQQLGFIAFGWLTMGQLLSLGLALFGILLPLAISARGSGHADGPPVPQVFAQR